MTDNLVIPAPRQRATESAAVGWKLRRAVQWPLQRSLMLLADRMNFFLVRGSWPYNQIDAKRFLRAPLFSIATDYVRNATLELICRDILAHDIPGAVAELGVYRGYFAALMHSHLPARPLHLFDTFEGFDTRDVAIDAGRDYVDDFHDFSNTSAASVRAQFPIDADVTLHKGWFPESAVAAADCTFALASIDTDLYQPVFAGLQWFWPRLSPGGSIMVHDYNNVTFRGSKAAVLDFLRDTPDAVCCPIPDVGGTAVIGKARTN